MKKLMNKALCALILTSVATNVSLPAEYELTQENIYSQIKNIEYSQIKDCENTQNLCVFLEDIATQSYCSDTANDPKNIITQFDLLKAAYCHAYNEVSKHKQNLEKQHRNCKMTQSALQTGCVATFFATGISIYLLGFYSKVRPCIFSNVHYSDLYSHLKFLHGLNDLAKAFFIQMGGWATTKMLNEKNNQYFYKLPNIKNQINEDEDLLKILATRMNELNILNI